MMTSDGMARPFVVAAWFSDGTQGYHAICCQISPAPTHAAALTVSQYYLRLGGKLPLVSITVMEIDRGTLNAGQELLDAIEERDKVEAAKVVSIVPGPPPQDEPA